MLTTTLIIQITAHFFKCFPSNFRNPSFNGIPLIDNTALRLMSQQQIYKVR